MEITYNGKVYEAKNKKEMIRTLREARLTYERIGELVGFSKAYVGHVLNKEFNIYGELDFPELRNHGLFESKTDEQIARDLDIPIFRVTMARKNLNAGRKENVVRLHRRRRDLVKFLFGQRYNPGNEFERWFEKAIIPLNKRQYEIMKQFYLDGAEESTHANINSDGTRVYRSVTRKELKEMLAEIKPKELVEKGILQNGSRSKNNRVSS